VLDSKNAGQLEQYKLGGKKVWKIEKFFVGKIMGASKGNAHPERMKEALSVVLSKVGLWSGTLSFPGILFYVSGNAIHIALYMNLWADIIRVDVVH